MANLEECANIKFCVKTSKSFTEYFKLMKVVYGTLLNAPQFIFRINILKIITRIGPSQSTGKADITPSPRCFQSQFFVNSAISGIYEFLHLPPLFQFSTVWFLAASQAESCTEGERFQVISKIKENTIVTFSVVSNSRICQMFH